MSAGLSSRKAGLLKSCNEGAIFVDMALRWGVVSGCALSAAHLQLPGTLPWLRPGGDFLCLKPESEGKVFAQSHIHPELVADSMNSLSKPMGGLLSPGQYYFQFSACSCTIEV